MVTNMKVIVFYLKMLYKENAFINKFVHKKVLEGMKKPNFKFVKSAPVICPSPLLFVYKQHVSTVVTFTAQKLERQSV